MGPVALKVTCSPAVWSNVHMVPAAKNTAGGSGVVALTLTNTADVFSVNVSIEDSPGTPTAMVVAPFGIMIRAGKLEGRKEKGGVFPPTFCLGYIEQVQQVCLLIPHTSPSGWRNCSGRGRG